MTWQDIEDIAVELYQVHPDVDPLAVRFTDLLTWIGGLPDFKDDLKRSNEQKLEAVQMEWYELWKEDHT
jgi:FeS assembly protein IscX